MYLHKWKEALVDWVNCLGLTTPISDLDELEDGVFFKLLLKNLIPAGDLSESDVTTKGIDTVFSYLKREFPSYDVPAIQSEESRLVYISSLLLFVSVTKEKIPLWRSRLCQDLQHDSQVKIKYFLECCMGAADHLDHGFLKSIIVGDFTPPESLRVTTPKRIAGACKNPMKELFESPRLMDKLSKDMRRLEAEKEALQLEKLELEDELRIEKERSERLQDHVHQKSELVVQLREELMECAQYMDEHKKHEIIADDNHRFETLEEELKESQKYVNLLVDEKEVISQEKCKLKEKLVASSDKIKKLEARALESERTNEELKISLSQKEQELQEIKLHCCELTEKMQSLSTHLNISLDSDTSMSVVNNIMSPFSDGERLSQAVVDVKLAEVEAENDKLKAEVDMTQEQSQKLRTQLEDIKVKLEKAKVALEAAKAENDQTQQQLFASTKERNEISSLLIEANSRIASLSETNSCLNKDILSFKNEITALKGLQEQLKEELYIKNNKLDEKQKTLDNLRTQLEERNAELDCVASEKSQLHHQLISCINEKEELKVSLQGTNDKMLSLTEGKSLCDEEILLLKNKLQVAEDSNLQLKEECAILQKGGCEKQKDLEEIKEQLDNLTKEKLVLKESISESEIVNNDLIQRLSTVKQERDESSDNLIILVRRLEDEVGIITKNEGMETHSIPSNVTVAEKVDRFFKFLQEYHLLSLNEKKDLKFASSQLENNLLQLKEREKAYLEEKLHHEKNFSDAIDRIRNFESHAVQLEKKIGLLTEQLLEKNSLIHKNTLTTEEKEEELKVLLEDKIATIELISTKKNEINKLKLGEEGFYLKRNLELLKETHPVLHETNFPGKFDATVNISGKNHGGFEVLLPGNTENIGNQVAYETDSSRQLGSGKEIWQVIQSWHELELFLVKLDDVHQELTSKISTLWEVLPKVQLKWYGISHSKVSSQVKGKEAEISKEVVWQLENMLIKLEKHKALLEKEQMGASHRAISWVLNGMQFCFKGEVADHDDSQLECSRKTSSSSIEEQKEEVYRSLEKMEEKLICALNEVNLTSDIFQEVVHSCSSAEDALQCLKVHGKIEKRMLSAVIDKQHSKIMMDENDRKALKIALEEMERAKLELESVCRKCQAELQASLLEKETLFKKAEYLTSQNESLLNHLQVCETKLESIAQETTESVQKIYEKKLARATEKLECAYRDDLDKFVKEREKCRQLEESCEKYRHMIAEYQGQLSDLKSLNQDLKRKMELLRKQKTVLEDKVYESQLHFGVGDAKQPLSLDFNRSHSAEHLANYFAKGEAAGMECVKFPPEKHLYSMNASTFSKDSGASNLPSGMGQIFRAEDEEGESFNATFLSDLKEGRCDLHHTTDYNHRKTLAVLREQNQQSYNEVYGSQQIVETPTKRLNELMRRNTLCLPHLKSSYPAETQIRDPRAFSEDCLKGNLSLKVPLLSGNQPRRLSGNNYGDLRRRKDKGQIAYMKPGPPTPGKNRHSSLQENEQIPDAKTQSTPGRILSWFGRRRRSVWDAENIPDTPSGKQKGVLRRPMSKQEHKGC